MEAQGSKENISHRPTRTHADNRAERLKEKGEREKQGRSKVKGERSKVKGERKRR